MKFAVVCAGFPPAFLGGGPIRSIEALLVAAPEHHECLVVTNNFDLGSRKPLVSVPRRLHQYEKADVRYLEPGLSGLLTSLRDLSRFRPHVVYVNSFFSLRMSLWFQLCAVFNPRTTIVLAPRGELDPGALAQKFRKKRLYIEFIKRIGLTRRCIWHVTSELELKNLRLAVNHPVRTVVRSNDTLLPSLAYRPKVGLEKRLRIVFLGRISRKKGLHKLLSALTRVSRPIQLDIIGPEEDHNYFEECHKIANSCGAHIEIRFLGALDRHDLLPGLNHYDAMVCPTDGENFGHVIAEGLSSGLPVIVEDVTPWTKVLENGGGTIVKSPAAEDWISVLNGYATASGSELHRRRIRAADAYDTWFASQQDPHLFDMIQEALNKATRG